MRYLLLIDHIATGGAERILLDYYYHLKAKGHEPHVFVLSGYDGQSEWTKGVNVVYGSDGDEDNLIKKTVQQVRLCFRLKRFVRAIQPDVIFSFLEKSNLLANLVRTKAVKVLTVHNVLSIQYTKVRSPQVRRVLYAMIRGMYNRCPNVVAVSKQVKDDLVNSFGVNEANIHVINNHVDREEIRRKALEPVTDFDFLPGVKYIMNIGRFSDQKAQWKLIKAFSLYLKDAAVEAHLVLIGKGEHEERIKKLVAELGLTGKITVLPFNINPYKYMAKADLFVLSSIFEGFPIVLAEASSLRIPFVGSRKAVPEEMFIGKAAWEKCIYDTVTLECDFTPNIVCADVKALARLIKAGLEDEVFRDAMLQSTAAWESQNLKTRQFDCYDKFSSKQT